MSGVNKAIILGNLGADPDVRYVPDGTAVATLSVATSEKWKDKQTGQPQERTEWHRIVFFGRQAEIARDYLHKGSKVYVEGQIRTRKWQDKEGQDRYTTEINGRHIQLLDPSGANTQNHQSQPPAAGQQTPQQGAPREQAYGGHPNAPQSAPPGFDYDDDIPFSNYEYRTFA